MFKLKRGEPIPDIDINIAFTEGGLGDNIVRLTPIKFVTEHWPHAKIRLIVPDYFAPLAEHVLKGNPQIKAVVNLTEAMKWPIKRAMTTKSECHTTLRTHLMHQPFANIADEVPPMGPEWNYPKIRINEVDITKYNLPEKYAVICTGYTAIVRKLNSNVINEIALYMRSKGYTPVFLGQKVSQTGGGGENVIGKFDERTDFALGIDLREQTSLLEAAAILGNSKVVCGLDNGLLHLAGCTDVKIIAAYTTTEPRTRVPIRDGILGKDVYTVVPKDDLDCRFCQTRMNFLPDHDFRNCLYDDLLCTTMIKSEGFIKHLDSIL